MSRVRDLTRVPEQEVELLRMKIHESIRAWVEAHVKGALDSFNNDVVANSEHLEKSLGQMESKLRQIDVILRGEKGDNGFASELRILREAEKRRAWRERTVIALLIAVLVKEFAAILLANS